MQRLRQVIKDFILPIAVATSLALVIQAAVAKPYEIPTPSMFPTIRDNDRVIANRLIYRFREPQRGDVIVFQPTLDARTRCEPSGQNTGIPFVKRVIGVPGDRVQIRGGRTLVNDRPFVVSQAAVPADDFAEVTVPPDRFFVLGDNRNQSCDSHLWAPDQFVHRDAIIGQAEVIYWPPTHWTFLG